MATKESFIGGHKVEFDPNDVYPDGVAMQGFRTEKQILLGEAATAATHAVRKAEFDADKQARIVEVASIADPAAELLSRSGDAEGELLIAVQASAFTIYAWSEESLTANSPYIVTGDEGFWVAIGGRYANQALTLASTLSVIGDTTLGGDVTLGRQDDLTSDGKVTINPPAYVSGAYNETGVVNGGLHVLTQYQQSLLADGATSIEVLASHIQVDLGAAETDVTMTAAPNIADGTYIGQLLYLTGYQADGNGGLVLNDVNTQADSGLRLGAATRKLEGSVGLTKNVLVLMWDGTHWIEVSFSTAYAGA